MALTTENEKPKRQTKAVETETVAEVKESVIPETMIEPVKVTAPPVEVRIASVPEKPKKDEIKELRHAVRYLAAMRLSNADLEQFQNAFPGLFED